MKAHLSIFVLAVAMLVAACTPIVTPGGNGTVNFSWNDTNMSTGNVSENTTVPGEEIDESLASFKIEGTEGELITIPVQAVDPDGDFLTYSFSNPFNEKGLWQTEIGDEGKYLSKVTVSDGTLSTSEYVLVTVKRANRPPVIECPERINVKETELIVLDCNIYDTDGDPVIVGYEGWMRSASYRTTYGDAGEHTVVVRARDRNHDSFAEVVVDVEKTNRAPTLEPLTDAEVFETRPFKVMPVTSDPDGDKVDVSFSEPLDEDGSWTPSYSDEGTYEVTVTASDGQADATQTFNLVVKKTNRAPVLKAIEPITVAEGDKVKIPVSVYDPDGDEVTTSFSGFMQTPEYTTSFDDAHPDGCNVKGCTADYYVNVTVSDGSLEASQTVKISVTDKNRPPRFGFGG